MKNPTDGTPHAPIAASRRDRLKPLELFGFSGVLAVFAGLIVLMSSRSLLLTLTFTVIAFVVSLVFVALLGLGGKPSTEELEVGKDTRGPGGGAR